MNLANESMKTIEKKLYLTSAAQGKYWNYIGDPLHPNTTLDAGLVKVENRSEICVDDYGAYVIRFINY